MHGKWRGRAYSDTASETLPPPTPTSINRWSESYILPVVFLLLDCWSIFFKNNFLIGGKFLVDWCRQSPRQGRMNAATPLVNLVQGQSVSKGNCSLVKNSWSTSQCRQPCRPVSSVIEGRMSAVGLPNAAKAAKCKTAIYNTPRGTISSASSPRALMHARASASASHQ